MADTELMRLQRMADAAEAFSIWTSTSIDEAPEIELSAWRVMQLVDGSRHLVGTNLTEDSTGRVSSRIVSLDAGRVTAVTDSGRVYRLVGGHGQSTDSNYVWRRWLRSIGSPASMDVTETVLDELKGMRNGQVD